MHADIRVLKRLNRELLSLIKVTIQYNLSNIFVTSHLSFLLKENWNIHRVVKSSRLLSKITAYLVSIGRLHTKNTLLFLN